jgi:hypothetical protein
MVGFDWIAPGAKIAIALATEGGVRGRTKKRFGYVVD